MFCFMELEASKLMKIGSPLNKVQIIIVGVKSQLTWLIMHCVTIDKPLLSISVAANAQMKW